MSEIRPRGRAGIACLNCRKQKIRCNGSQPCERCGRMKLQCLFGPSTSIPSSPNRRKGSSSVTIKTLEISRFEGSRPPTPDGLPRYGLTSAMRTTPRRRNSFSQMTPSHIGADHVSRPFSTFTYQPAPDPPVQDILVPRCAQPFPELQDPVECGIMPLTSARWLFDFYQTYCAPYIPLSNMTFEGTRQRSPFLLTSMLCVAHVNTPVDLGMLPTLPLEAHLLGDRRTADLLANLTLNFAAASLIRRAVRAEDVIATLNVVLWNLRRNAASGPSSWPLVGHGQRLSRRIGIHDDPPLSKGWFSVTALDIYDHFLTLGYGRPLTNDRPTRPSHDSLLSLHDSPFAASLVAQSELVQSMRRLIRWIARPNDEDPQALENLLVGINDDLDTWSFRWTSPASELSPLLNGCGAFTLVLAHHVRLCLNMLPLQTHSTGETTPLLSRGHRLALSSAVEIIDTFYRDFTSPVIPIPSLRFAPGIAGTILAHAALCLLPRPLAMHPGTVPSATLASENPSPVANKYFSIALDLLRGDRSNQGHFTPTFARTIGFLLGQQPVSRQHSPGQGRERLGSDIVSDPSMPWSHGAVPSWPESLDNDLSMGIMGWFEHDAFQVFDAAPHQSLGAPTSQG